MKLTLAAITSREHKSRVAGLPGDDYVSRASRLQPSESIAFRSEAALLDTLERQAGRAPAHLCLFDSAGEALSSLEFAHFLGKLRDGGTQRAIFAIGPASGWSPAALARADRILSLGRMTLPHELARVVVAEQIYRALTILAGHPYHLGH